jgi:hypothetical protein
MGEDRYSGTARGFLLTLPLTCESAVAATQYWDR